MPRSSWALAGLALVACSQPEPKGSPNTGDPGPTSPSTGTPTGTTTGDPTVTTPSRGALITGIDPAMSWTDCAIDPEILPDPVGTLASMGWELRTGGQIDANLWYYLGPQLTPAENYWGGSVRSSLYYGQDLPTVSYGFEVDANLAMAATPAPIPFADAFVEGGLARGYYGAIVPYLLYTGFEGGGTWDSGGYNPPGVLYDQATRITISAIFGVDGSGVLAPVSFAGDTLPPSLILRLGGNAWNGDEALTDQYCEVVFYLDGIQQQPL